MPISAIWKSVVGGKNCKLTSSFFSKSASLQVKLKVYSALAFFFLYTVECSMREAKNYQTVTPGRSQENSKIIFWACRKHKTMLG